MARQPFQSHDNYGNVMSQHFMALIQILQNQRKKVFEIILEGCKKNFSKIVELEIFLNFTSLEILSL